MISHTRSSLFSACNIEKAGVAWGRGYEFLAPQMCLHYCQSLSNLPNHQIKNFTKVFHYTVFPWNLTAPRNPTGPNMLPHGKTTTITCMHACICALYVLKNGIIAELCAYTHTCTCKSQSTGNLATLKVNHLQNTLQYHQDRMFVRFTPPTTRSTGYSIH